MTDTSTEAWQYTDDLGHVWNIDEGRMAPYEGGYLLIDPAGGVPYFLLPVNEPGARRWEVQHPLGHPINGYGYTDVFDVIGSQFHWPLNDVRVWLGGDHYTRTFRVAGGDLVTKPCPMGQLAVGDVFVGPDGYSVYEVTGDCASNEHGWLFVHDVSMSDQEVRKLLEDHPRAVEPGCDPRDGFFDFTPDTAMHLVDGATDWWAGWLADRRGGA